MFRGIMLALLLVPATASAIELKLGLLYAQDQLYNGEYTDRNAQGYTYDHNGIIGKVEVSHHFPVDDKFGINIFATHYSYFAETDPHFGINLFGAEMQFSFDK